MATWLCWQLASQQLPQKSDVSTRKITEINFRQRKWKCQRCGGGNVWDSDSCWRVTTTGITSLRRYNLSQWSIPQSPELFRPKLFVGLTSRMWNGSQPSSTSTKQTSKQVKNIVWANANAALRAWSSWWRSGKQSTKESRSNAELWRTTRVRRSRRSMRSGAGANSTTANPFHTTEPAEGRGKGHEHDGLGDLDIQIPEGDQKVCQEERDQVQVNKR